MSSFLIQNWVFVVVVFGKDKNYRAKLKKYIGLRNMEKCGQIHSYSIKFKNKQKIF